ncbi:Zinc finger HIT domain-containing protein 1 [Echinococcus granulosus]|uniref:Zinc finger HIT domain containing protein 1 n=1 Tax=Echinococcus granulosus TaxID=6210 RepID=A0A068WK14_ECHGR|nr:Zinc finger HIT domain-containing protein 1 [Echinococcus granulosus]CDS20118.1 Zinc finger HIT domain containing protein 1 [Echinococcus granulosus]
MTMDKRDVLREVQRRILDNDARKRRLRKTLEILEQDNHVEDSLNDTKTTKRPKFEDDTPGHAKRRRRTTIGRAKFKKTFELLLDEEYQATKGGQVGASYFTAAVPDSRLPPRKFCSVCGFLGAYVCVVCGSRYCSIKCPSYLFLYPSLFTGSLSPCPADSCVTCLITSWEIF